MKVGYCQLIDQPTHITKESSSCIDLIFTSDPSVISASGVELSLYEKCHRNLIYGKINSNVLLPPPYICEVCDYNNAKVELSIGILFSKEKLLIKRLIF